MASSAAFLAEKLEGLELERIFRHLSRQEVETFLTRCFQNKRECCLVSAVAAGACCLYLGWNLGRRRGIREGAKKPSSATSSPLHSSRCGDPYERSESTISVLSSIDHDSESCDNYRLALVVRSDLRMGVGKTATQCCRAFWGEVKKLQKTKDPNIYAWEQDGQTIVVYHVTSEEGLMQLRKEAKKNGVISHTMMDKGNNRQKTAMAIGPAKSETMISLTKHLRLV
ncbi:hypothetical protein BSKO_08347 [Bryopsis sp. KO-2023]|nr:hypothetical protein BSKO_08347 [Bryopsis sp. KO-2023]